VGWGDEQIKAFCKMQLTAQNWHLVLRYPEAKDSIVMKGDQPVGQLKVYERDEEILLVDIALIADVQRQGIATHPDADVDVQSSQKLGSRCGCMCFSQVPDFRFIRNWDSPVLLMMGRILRWNTALRLQANLAKCIDLLIINYDRPT
jgi:hypothetical protein